MGEQLQLFRDLPSHNTVIGFPDRATRPIPVEEAVEFIKDCYSVCLVGYHGEEGTLKVVAGNMDIKGAVFILRQAETELL